MATFVPLAAYAPSEGSAGGSVLDGIRDHVPPPLVVEKITNCPSTESLNAIPCVGVEKAMASRKMRGSVFFSWSAQCAPASVVL
jgi:hypothetical protein